ncbi:MAG: RNA polymerase sigma factor [Lapillicoccus sp.]
MHEGDVASVVEDDGGVVEDDAADWALLRAGSETGLEHLFRRHSGAVYTFAFRRLASWQAAEDVVQGTFTTIWRRAGEGRLEPLELPSARPYLLGTASNECRNHGRSARRRRALVARLPRSLVTPDHALDAAARVDDERAMSRVRRAMTRIPDNQREAIELVVWSQCSLAEASSVLGVPVSTLKSRLFRGRRALAGLLDPLALGEDRDEGQPDSADAGGAP